MIHDPIVTEVRRVREEYARRFNYDLWAIFEDLKQREQTTGRPVVDRSRPLRPKDASGATRSKQS